MKIGVVADTHSLVLPAQMLKDFKQVDLIIHAGDFCQLKDYEVIAGIKEVKAVHGNMDDRDITRRFPRSQVLVLDGVKIGLFHGEGPPHTIVEKVEMEFKSQKLDVFIFGHSHQPLNEKKSSVLYFNPGSPNDKIFAPYCSYGMLDIVKGQVTGTIIKVKS